MAYIGMAYIVMTQAEMDIEFVHLSTVKFDGKKQPFVLVVLFSKGLTPNKGLSEVQ